MPTLEQRGSDAGSTRLIMLPRNKEVLEVPSGPIVHRAPAAPGNVVPRIVRPEKPVQCVPFARAQSGIDIRGNASRWWQLAAGRYMRAKRPEEGSVFVMKGYQTAQRGHVAVVRKVVDERTIVVDHANWGNDGRIYLQAPIRDLSPGNDWSQVQVWFTPTNQWGRRVYKAKGFILPAADVAAAGGGAVVAAN